jgi:hypothetical protein
MQRTHGTVSDQQVLWANFLTQIPFSFLLTFLFEHDKLGVLLHLGSTEVLEVFALAAGVNWFANWVQQASSGRGSAPTMCHCAAISCWLFVCRCGMTAWQLLHVLLLLRHV